MEQSRSRVETVPLVAGVAVLDLVNTVSWRGRPERVEDHLQSAAHCLRWAQRAGVLSAEEVAELAAPRTTNGLTSELTSELTRELTEFREVVARVAAQLVAPTSGVLDAGAQTAIRDAYAHGELAAGPHGHRWQVSTLDRHTVRRRLALQLEELLRTAPGRIGFCEDEECRWVFLDTSRAQNRRWCRSTDCGNRHRVRAHQRRITAPRGPAATVLRPL